MIVSNWENNDIQFPRLIAELDAVGAFTEEVYDELQDSMDLTRKDISELIERAQEVWEEIKQTHCKRRAEKSPPPGI